MRAGVGSESIRARNIGVPYAGCGSGTPSAGRRSRIARKRVDPDRNLIIVTGRKVVIIMAEKRCKHLIHITVQVEENLALQDDLNELCRKYNLFGFAHQFMAESIEHGAIMSAIRNGSAEIHREQN